METSGQLYLSLRSGYNPSLPSPLSGGKFKPQLVLLGLVGAAGTVLAAGCLGHKVGSVGGATVLLGKVALLGALWWGPLL